MAVRRKRHKRLTKLEAARRLAQHQRRERVISTGGQIALRILSDPEAMRGVGMLLEAAGRALQRTADDVKEKTPPTPLLPADVLDLSAFRARKKGPSDG